MTKVSLILPGSVFMIAQSTILNASPYFEGTLAETLSAGSQALEGAFLGYWEKARVRRAARLQSSKRGGLRHFHVPNYASLKGTIANDLAPANRRGLLGEIVTQIFMSDCCRDINILYVNWEHTGTANQYGIDLVGMRHNSQIVMIESKFCGASAQSDSGKASYVIQRIRKALSYLEEPSEFEMKISDAYFRIILSGRPRSAQEAEILKRKFESGNYEGFVTTPTVYATSELSTILDSSRYSMPVRAAVFVSITISAHSSILTHSK